MLFSFMLWRGLSFFTCAAPAACCRGSEARMREAELQHQKMLLHSVIRSQEEERARIGRDLHDDAGTALSRLRMSVDSFAMQTNDDPLLAAFISHCKTSIDAIVTDVRNIAHNLSPSSLRLYGFTEAMEELADTVNSSGMLHVDIRNEAAAPLDALGHSVALALYRVLQELLAITARHRAGT